jgi:hypothetical protein
MVHLTGAPNYPAAANPAIAVLCYVEEQGRAVAGPDRHLGKICFAPSATKKRPASTSPQSSTARQRQLTSAWSAPPLLDCAA